MLRALEQFRPCVILQVDAQSDNSSERSLMRAQGLGFRVAMPSN